MIINASNLRFASSAISREREEITVQGGISRSGTNPGAASGSQTGRPVAVAATFASRENVMLRASQSSYLYSRSQVSQADRPDCVQVHSREETLQSLVSYAFSREVRITGSATLGSSASSARLGPQGQSIATRATATLSRAYRYESEQQSTLTIEGNLQLADNRNVDFVVHTRMDSSLQFQSGSGQYASTAVRTDPLVINLHGGAAQLTDTAFSFDIDGDGSSESVSFATGGSGFIAFDRNGDNRINDGSELFGSRSGDGFADLAQYDDDGNGFIDSNDSIFSRLTFYSRDEDGNEFRQNLSEAGVAAIGLQSADSPAVIRGSATQELGSVRSTGIFVMASGAVGTVQQVDLASRDLDAEEAFAADFDNAQLTDAAASATLSPQQQEMERILQRLQSMQAEFMAKLDAMQNSDEESGGKSLLELLVDGLQEFLHEQNELRAKRADEDKATGKQGIADYTE